MATNTSLKTATTERIEDGLHAAKKFAQHRAHDLEDIRDGAGLKIRRAPLTSVALELGAGVLLGAALASFRRA
jgi:hypothetical protein